MRQKRLEEILQGSIVSIEASFLSKMSLTSLSEEISSATGENVKVHGHSPDQSIVTRCPRLGKNAKTVKTRAMNYTEATQFFSKLCTYLKDNTIVNDRSYMSWTVGFDYLLSDAKRVSSLNLMKFALEFNDEYFSDKFEGTGKCPLRKSLLDCIQSELFSVIFSDNGRFMVVTDDSSRVDLRHTSEDFVKFNGIVGNYVTKKKEALECIDYSILNLYRLLLDNTLSKYGEDRFLELSTAGNCYRQAYINPEFFNKYLPGIKLTIDLSHEPEVLKAVWGHIKDGLFKVIMSIGSKEGEVNYESSDSTWQIKGFELKDANLKGVTVINCSGNGKFLESNIVTCNLSNSVIENSEVGSESNIDDSLIEETNVEKRCVLCGCTIDNINKIVDCDVEGGVWVRGKFGENTKVDDSCSVVDHVEAKRSDFIEKDDHYEEPKPEDYMNYNLDQYINA